MNSVIFLVAEGLSFRLIFHESCFHFYLLIPTEKGQRFVSKVQQQWQQGWVIKNILSLILFQCKCWYNLIKVAVKDAGYVGGRERERVSELLILYSSQDGKSWTPSGINGLKIFSHFKGLISTRAWFDEIKVAAWIWKLFRVELPKVYMWGKNWQRYKCGVSMYLYVSFTGGLFAETMANRKMLSMRVSGNLCNGRMLLKFLA